MYRKDLDALKGIAIIAGVVRDVPELDVMKGTEYRGMFSDYCDRVYNYKSDFTEDNGKLNVIVEGVSFGRDFANILLESQYKDSINLSYIYKWENGEFSDLVKKADYIFTFNAKGNVPQYVWNYCKNESHIYGIGTKTYGACNGQIYIRRFNDDYYKSRVKPVPGYEELNNEWREQWGNNYIDFMTPITCDDGSIQVFTFDYHYISQDGQHLTRSGAKFYAYIY